MYTLRFPFRVPEGQAIGIDDRAFAIASHNYLFKGSDTSYEVTVDGFATEAAAKAHALFVWAGLTWVGLHGELAPYGRPQIGEVSFTDDPVATGVRLKFNRPIDGLAEGSAAFVYPTGKSIVTITGGKATVTMSNAVDSVVKYIRDLAEFATQVQPLTDQKLRVALELYQAHFSEASMNSRFLTLVMCLEALATGTKRPMPIIDLLQRWQDEIEKSKPSFAGDTECLAALESLARELDFRRENSIRSQIRTLVLSTLQGVGDPDAEAVAKTTLDVYDKRSTLVHEGRLENAALNEAFKNAQQIVRRILRIRFKAFVSQSCAPST